MASSWTLNGLATKLGLSSATRPRSNPRNFPNQGFAIVDGDLLLEEEGIAGYNSEHYYPVRLGEVFDDRFQVVTKLGFGSSSSIWLARDLQDHQYVALKIYIHNSARHRELPFYQHLDNILPSKHRGAGNIRNFFGSFEVVGPHGTHIVLALQVAQMSIRDMDTVFMNGRGFDEKFVKGAMQELLKAVDFLHTEIQAVHTDIHSGNLLLGSNDDSMFKTLEDDEHKNPVSRKKLSDRTIYCSRLMKPKVGPFLLSDFGETRLGPGPHDDDIMPMMYRAPEVVLWTPWSYPVDIWSVGLTAWDLLEGKTLFTARKGDGSFSNAAHLAELIAALGPPPADLLARHRERALEYWDENDKWGESVPILTEKTLEVAETKLKDNTKFLAFIRRTLTWDPNTRPTAKELLQDPWLTG